jgi:hypothetical protein
MPRGLGQTPVLPDNHPLVHCQNLSARRGPKPYYSEPPHRNGNQPAVLTIQARNAAILALSAACRACNTQ